MEDEKPRVPCTGPLRNRTGTPVCRVQCYNLEVIGKQFLIERTCLLSPSTVPDTVQYIQRNLNVASA